MSTTILPVHRDELERYQFWACSQMGFVWLQTAPRGLGADTVDG